MVPRSVLAACLASAAVLLAATSATAQQPPPGQSQPPPGQLPPTQPSPPAGPGGAPAAGQPPPGTPAPPPGYGWGPPQGYPAPPPNAGYAPRGYPPPQGYPYPYPYYYPPQAMASPRTLPYDEGQPVPPGYHPDTRARKGLVIAGAVTFGSAFLISVLGASAAVSDGGQSSDEFAPLFIPVAGPFVTLGTVSSDSSAAVPLFILDGVAQVAGVVMFIGGLVASESILMRDDVRASKLLEPSVLVGPRAAALRWRF